MEKCGIFWKNSSFSGRILPDWGNTAWADMAGLGSKEINYTIQGQNGLDKSLGLGPLLNWRKAPVTLLSLGVNPHDSASCLRLPQEIYSPCDHSWRLLLIGQCIHIESNHRTVGTLIRCNLKLFSMLKDYDGFLQIPMSDVCWEYWARFPIIASCITKWVDFNELRFLTVYIIIFDLL